MTQKEELSIFLKNREIAVHSDLWIALAIFEAAEAIRELKNVLEVDLINPYLLNENEISECLKKKP